MRFLFGKNKRAVTAMLYPAAIVFLFLIHVQIFAHDGLHEQIVAVTEQIKKEPDNAALYLKRAELFRLHEEFSDSENDYNKAEKLNPTLSTINLGRGKLFLAKGELSKAEKFTKIYLKKEPNGFEGILTFARIAVKHKNTKTAVRYFSKAIDLAPEDSAELYLERAEALASANKNNEALDGLDKGIEKFGNLITLQNYAVELEVKRKNYDAALVRLDKAAGTMERKEYFLLRRGEILLEAGKTCQARTAFLESQKGFENLTPFRKKVRAVREQITRLEKLLAQTSTQKCAGIIQNSFSASIR